MGRVGREFQWVVVERLNHCLVGAAGQPLGVGASGEQLFQVVGNEAHQAAEMLGKRSGVCCAKRLSLDTGALGEAA